VLFPERGRPVSHSVNPLCSMEPETLAGAGLI
jgi:hypothetical protein